MLPNKVTSPTEEGVQGIWKDIKIKDPLILVFSKPQRTSMSKEWTNNLFSFCNVFTDVFIYQN
jgi:hypothetical protein